MRYREKGRFSGGVDNGRFRGRRRCRKPKAGARFTNTHAFAAAAIESMAISRGKKKVSRLLSLSPQNKSCAFARDPVGCQKCRLISVFALRRRVSGANTPCVKREGTRMPGIQCSARVPPRQDSSELVSMTSRGGGATWSVPSASVPAMLVRRFP